MSDDRDKQFVTGERTKPRAYYNVKNGIEPCIARAKSYAPYADLIWMETGTPDLQLAKQVLRRRSRADFPDQLLAYNCSPVVQLVAAPGRRRQSRSSRRSSARWASRSSSSPWPVSTHSTTRMFDLAHGYARNQHDRVTSTCRTASSRPPRSVASPPSKHQREVGAGYFDRIATTVDPNSVDRSTRRAPPKRASSTRSLSCASRRKGPRKPRFSGTFASVRQVRKIRQNEQY